MIASGLLPGSQNVIYSPGLYTVPNLTCYNTTSSGSTPQVVKVWVGGSGGSIGGILIGQATIGPSETFSIGGIEIDTYETVQASSTVSGSISFFMRGSAYYSVLDAYGSLKVHLSPTPFDGSYSING